MFTLTIGEKADQRLEHLKSMLDRLEGLQDDMRTCSTSIDKLKDNVADKGPPAGKHKYKGPLVNFESNNAIFQLFKVSWSRHVYSS